MNKFHLFLGILLLLFLCLCMNIESFGNPFDKPFEQQRQQNNNPNFKNESLCKNGENCPKSVKIKIREPSASADYIEPPYSSLDESLGEFINENDTGINYREIFMRLGNLEDKISIYNNNLEEQLSLNDVDSDTEFCISIDNDNNRIVNDDVNCELIRAELDGNGDPRNTGCCNKNNDNIQCHYVNTGSEILDNRKYVISCEEIGRGG